MSVPTHTYLYTIFYIFKISPLSFTNTLQELPVCNREEILLLCPCIIRKSSHNLTSSKIRESLIFHKLFIYKNGFY